MVIYQEKKPIENEVNLIKAKPTAGQNEYDLKFLNCHVKLSRNSSFQSK
jgi:hypothetical protein